MCSQYKVIHYHYILQYKYHLLKLQNDCIQMIFLELIELKNLIKLLEKYLNGCYFLKLISHIRYIHMCRYSYLLKQLNDKFQLLFFKFFHSTKLHLLFRELFIRFYYLNLIIHIHYIHIHKVHYYHYYFLTSKNYFIRSQFILFFQQN